MKKKQYAVTVSGTDEAKTKVEKTANSMTGAFMEARAASCLLENQKTEADKLFKDCFKVIANTSLSEIASTAAYNGVYVKVKRFMI